MRAKPSILIVNDDGVNSQGICSLINVMRDIGDVHVVAPDSNRSGYSHAMTLHRDISIEHLDKENNVFSCSGTPVDCVKIALNLLLDRPPDLCVSGINHGSNHSINGLYSGTLHAAMEGTVQGIKSMSFSHLSYDEKKDFSEFNTIIKSLSEKVLQIDFLENITLNINFPDVPYSQIKGLKVCSQGQGVWQEKFQLLKKKDNKESYLIGGNFKADNSDTSTDSWALANKYISLVPVSVNQTATQSLDKLKFLENVF